MESETPKLRVGFVVGQSVRITDGPFTDFIGVVDHVFQDRGKVSFLVSFSFYLLLYLKDLLNINLSHLNHPLKLFYYHYQHL